ncbi:MAG: type II secretion system protein GspL [Hydrogenovibrio sp.]|nr:type II secretion system protein GspL [Hydrogenovibrio sp.]
MKTDSYPPPNRMNSSQLSESIPYMTLKGQMSKNDVDHSTGADFVWVPTEQVTFLSLFVPGKKASEWRNALPYAAEEYLSQPIETLFISVFEREASGMTHIGVVEKDKMLQWLDELKAQHLTNAQLIPDCFRVPLAAETEGEQAIWTQYDDPVLHKSLIRTARYSGVSGSKDWAQQYCELAKKNQPDLDVELLDTLTDAALPDSHRFGLRQGEFSPQNQSVSRLKVWRWPMTVGLLTLLLLWANMLLQTYQIEHQAEEYKQQTVALFKQLFPDVKRVINVRAQTKTRLLQVEKAKTGASVSRLLQRIDPLLSPLVAEQKVSVQHLSWQNQQLILSLSAPQSQTLQTLVDQLNRQANAQLKLTKISPKQVEGTINVRAN